MRIIAWCLLVAAMIFAGVSNRINDEAFEDHSKDRMQLTVAPVADK